MTKNELNDYIIKNNITKINDLIDIICSDFESRICKNCKHFNVKDNICGLPEITMLVKETFGCNRFKKKENNETNENEDLG